MREHDGHLHGGLEIRGLRCKGRHGAYAGEQEQERVFLVDLHVAADVGPAVRSDRLEAALDFAELADVVRRVVGGPPRVLLERAAVEVASALLERFATIQQVRVRLRKPEPPGLDATEESAEVTLTRESSADWLRLLE